MEYWSDGALEKANTPSPQISKWADNSPAWVTIQTPEDADLSRHGAAVTKAPSGRQGRARQRPFFRPLDLQCRETGICACLAHFTAWRGRKLLNSSLTGFR